jgi:hypothetical protein
MLIDAGVLIVFFLIGWFVFDKRDASKKSSIVIAFTSYFIYKLFYISILRGNGTVNEAFIWSFLPSFIVFFVAWGIVSVKRKINKKQDRGINHGK